MAKYSMSRLIIVSEFVDPEGNSTGYYWYKLIAGLSKENFEVAVICPDDSYRLLRSPVENVNYLRFRAGTFSGKGLLSRLLKQFVQTFRLSFVLAKTVRKGDIVFSGTNPAIMLAFLAAFKLFGKYKWVVLLHDIFPDNLIAAGILTPNSYVYRVLSIVFSKIYNAPDFLIAIGRDMQSLMCGRVKGESKVVYIPNWVDLDDIAVKSRSQAVSLLGELESGAIVFQFFGNIGRVQGVQYLLDAISKVKSQNAFFVFIGGGVELDYVKEYIDTGKDPRVKYLGQIPFARNDEGLAACDVALVSLAPGMNGLGVPSKAYFSMAAGRPVLVTTDENSELHLMLKENDRCGWFVPVGDSDALAAKIDWLCTVEGQNEIQSMKARSVVESKYCLENILGEYESVINSLAG